MIQNTISTNPMNNDTKNVIVRIENNGLFKTAKVKTPNTYSEMMFPGYFTMEQVHASIKLFIIQQIRKGVQL